MRHTRSVTLVVTLGSLAMLSVACRATTAPKVEARLAAGTYVLESISGRGPATGSFVLTRDGQATRRVQYATAGGLSRVYIAVGTFALSRDQTIAFALREDSGQSVHVWRVGGQRAEEGFSIRYPDPADGPDIVEIYRRQ